MTFSTLTNDIFQVAEIFVKGEYIINKYLYKKRDILVVMEQPSNSTCFLPYPSLGFWLKISFYGARQDGLIWKSVIHNDLIRMGLRYFNMILAYIFSVEMVSLLIFSFPAMIWLWVKNPIAFGTGERRTERHFWFETVRGVKAFHSLEKCLISTRDHSGTGYLRQESIGKVWYVECQSISLYFLWTPMWRLENNPIICCRTLFTTIINQRSIR